MSPDARRRAVVWFHRSRAIVWAIVGAVSFPLGWANSVVLVWIASAYANTVSDWTAAEAADNRELVQLLEQIRDQNAEILARLPTDGGKMTIDPPGFHAHSGWFFRREPDGSVRITAPDSLGPGAQQTVVLDPGTWASAVASVSAAGEDGATFRAAERFHAGEDSERTG